MKASRLDYNILLLETLRALVIVLGEIKWVLTRKGSPCSIALLVLCRLLEEKSDVVLTSDEPVNYNNDKHDKVGIWEQ